MLEGNRVSRISVRGFAVASATAVTTVGAVVGVASGSTAQPANNEAEATASDATLLADIPAGQQAQVQTASLTQQAETQAIAADNAAQKSAEEAARKQAAEDAVAKQKAAADAKQKAEEEAKKKAEALRLAKLAASYAIPTSSYTITSTFGEAGSMWSSGYHTGLDFAAPTGTPIKAIHTGTIKSAGWSGAYGYRTVLELEDGTELWFCHQSSIGVTVGQKVTTGDTIGRVGATGNVTGPHLHLEVHTPDGTGIDPMAWLRARGLTV